MTDDLIKMSLSVQNYPVMTLPSLGEVFKSTRIENLFIYIFYSNSGQITNNPITKNLSGQSTKFNIKANIILKYSYIRVCSIFGRKFANLLKMQLS